MRKITVFSLLSWGNEKPLLTWNPPCDHRGLLWGWQSLRMKTTWISEEPLEGKYPAEWTEQQWCFICKWQYFGLLSQWDLFLITAKPSQSWLIQNWSTVIPSSGNKILSVRFSVPGQGEQSAFRLWTLWSLIKSERESTM